MRNFWIELAVLLFSMVLSAPAFAWELFDRQVALSVNVLTNVDHRLDPWMRAYMPGFRKRVSALWFPNTIQDKRRCKISFVLDINGSRQNIIVSEPSGDAAFDATALSAIQNANQPPLPAYVPALQLVATFDNRYVNPSELALNHARYMQWLRMQNQVAVDPRRSRWAANTNGDNEEWVPQTAQTEQQLARTSDDRVSDSEGERQSIASSTDTMEPTSENNYGSPRELEIFQVRSARDLRTLSKFELSAYTERLKEFLNAPYANSR